MNNYLKMDQILALLDETRARVKDLQAKEDSLLPLEPKGFVYKYPNTTLDGRFIPITWSDAQCPEQKAISDADIRTLSAQFKVPFAHVKAVIEVESSGSGFLLSEPAPARPKILFEAAWFYKLTPKPVSKIRPDLSSPTWNKKLYKGGSEEYTRLEDAMEFDEIQALKSASWGLGQIMGVNYYLAGCQSIQQFVVEEFMGEKMQLAHMLAFIKNAGLLDELKAGDWKGFARGYNGSEYAANQYDTKLAKAAAKYK